MSGAHWQSSVLSSVTAVAESSKLVQINKQRLADVADWMAYEEFPEPTGGMLFDFGNDPKVIMDFTMVLNTLNFAFTDFNSGVKFEVDYQGLRRSDSEAMVACMHKAYTAGIPFFDGSFLANVTRSQLEDIFRGNIEMPMLDDRVSILNEVGAVLESKYQGSYSNFIKSCSPRLYDGGSGVLERLTSEFPRFNDVSDFHGRRVEIFKLAQLGIWSLHLTLAPRKAWQLEDANMVTAFADYIVPVGLRVMKVFEYTPELESQINGLQEVKRDSDAEIELRANSIYAIALLTDEINKRRSGLKPLLMPQVDWRFWKTYHATHWPHHLTRTIMY